MGWLGNAIRGALTGDWGLGAKHYEDLASARRMPRSDRQYFASKAIEAHKAGRHGRGGHTPGRRYTFRTRGKIRRVR